MKKVLKLTALFIGITMISGCSVVPTATPEQKQAAMKKIAPSDKAMVHIIRSEKGSFQMHSIEVRAGDKSLHTSGKSFSIFNLLPYKGKMET